MNILNRNLCLKATHMDTGKKINFRSTGVDKTLEVGRRLGRLLIAGDVIALIGELGAGKTTFVKGIAEGVGIKNLHIVKSPTFSLVNIYEGRVPVYHFDAYRLEDTYEMLAIGSDEMIFGKGISIIEWADKVFRCLPEKYMKVTFSIVSENERSIEFGSIGDRYDKTIDCLNCAYK